jgi:phospholipid/cholesterol/gamma-HCH transport system ATP-binding protein
MVTVKGESSARAAESAPAVDAVISIQGVSKQFGSHVVLEDISFDVPRGETSAILGPSGTGKSVLLKVVIGLLRPETGQVYIDGEPIVGVREKEVLRIRRKIGVLFQDGALFGSMNLFDNIAFPLIEHTNKTDKEVRNIVLHKSELVGLVNHLHKLPGEVSGGMRKRAGLARALVLEPQILFFDEPDSGLDPVRVAYLDGLINSVHDETGATFFIISHNIESVKRTAHHLGLLFRSRLVGFGSKEEMMNSKVAVIEQFLAGRPEGPISMDEMADAVEGEDDPFGSPPGAVGLSPPVSPLADIVAHRSVGPDEDPDSTVTDRLPVNPGCAL